MARKRGGHPGFPKPDLSFEKNPALMLDEEMASPREVAKGIHDHKSFVVMVKENVFLFSFNPSRGLYFATIDGKELPEWWCSLTFDLEGDILSGELLRMAEKWSSMV